MENIIKVGRKPNHTRIAIIFTMIKNGKNLTEIAKSLGVSRQTISETYNKYKANYLVNVSTEKDLSTETKA